MTRSRAIKEKCLEYCSYSQKELSLCHIIDCPLWEYRFGNSMKSKFFEQRMKNASKRYPKDFSFMLKLVSEYLSTCPNSSEIDSIRMFFENNFKI